jgi:hypothetical protein
MLICVRQDLRFVVTLGGHEGSCNIKTAIVVQVLNRLGNLSAAIEANGKKYVYARRPKKGHAPTPSTLPLELVRIQLRGDRREMLVKKSWHQNTSIGRKQYFDIDRSKKQRSKFTTAKRTSEKDST